MKKATIVYQSGLHQWLAVALGDLRERIRPDDLGL